MGYKYFLGIYTTLKNKDYSITLFSGLTGTDYCLTYPICSLHTYQHHDHNAYKDFRQTKKKLKILKLNKLFKIFLYIVHKKYS